MDLISKLRDISPMLCRILARHRYGKPMTTKEIATASGIHIHLFEAYSWSPSWDRIPIIDAFAFSRACGVDFGSYSCMNRVYCYLAKNPTFQYLRKSGHWKDYYAPMLRAWYEGCNGRQFGNDPMLKPIRKLLLRLHKAYSLETKHETKNV